MPQGKRTEDSTTLQMALMGYQIQRQKIEDSIREIEALLHGQRGAASAAVKKAGGRRVLSAAARRRISEAQKKRWAEARRKKA